MQKKIGLLLTLVSVISIVWILYIQLKVDFWMKPPAEKLAAVWAEDMSNLLKSKTLPKEWSEIHDISIRTDNSPLHDWTAKIKPPITTNPKGRYRLEIFFVLLLEGNRYGTVAEFDLIEIASKNKVWELGRTYKLGYLY